MLVKKIKKCFTVPTFSLARRPYENKYRADAACALHISHFTGWRKHPMVHGHSMDSWNIRIQLYSSKSGRSRSNDRCPRAHGGTHPDADCRVRGIFRHDPYTEGKAKLTLKNVRFRAHIFYACISNILFRDAAPETRRTRDSGTRTCSARARITA